jgi:hypothetical protein
MHIFGYKGWNHKLTKYKPAEAIDIIVKEVAPILKSAGYKKIGRTWTKDMHKFLLIISIEGSRWNREETGAAFDVSYGIFIPQVFRALNYYVQPKHPKVYNCAFVQATSGRGSHIEWEIFDNTDMETLKASVSAQIKEECIDTFAPISTLEDIKTLLINGRLTRSYQGIVGLAVLCAEMGDMVKARKYFDDIINDHTRTPQFRDWVAKIARQYKIS